VLASWLQATGWIGFLESHEKSDIALANEEAHAGAGKIKRSTGNASVLPGSCIDTLSACYTNRLHFPSPGSLLFPRMHCGIEVSLLLLGAARCSIKLYAVSSSSRKGTPG
jgi:hypothetical protein